MFGFTKPTYDYVICGLGNPSKKYEGTRHNAGFIVVDKLARKFGADKFRSKLEGLCADVRIADKRVLLVMPQTFMNESGRCVEAVLGYYKIPPENLLVICDDINFPPGKLRIRPSGSHGGQNGVKDIISRLDTDNFPRVKMGVGAKPSPEYDLAAWVLSVFKPDERTAFDNAADTAVEAIEFVLTNGIEQARNKYNGK
ncbi:MAG: aminoacyl-tRNA hydrolase [Oscillospiraceae bacterium]|jgi:PTH1 family peptidyl-tRNA hydrolase|nr:aminoacyl-tRNA hydrolase [Oscillospiraceae bacterium]